MIIYTFFRGMPKNSSILRLWSFSWAIAHSFGSRGDLQGPWHLVYFWEARLRTHPFYILGPFSWAIVHCFGVLGWFTRNMTFRTF
jgi:hypothetical protein